LHAMTSTTGARVVGELGGHVRRALPVRRDSLTPATACTSVAPTRPVPAGEHVAAYRTAAVKLLAPNGVLPTELQAGKVSLPWQQLSHDPLVLSTTLLWLTS
jgi:hypothetical protein